MLCTNSKMSSSHNYLLFLNVTVEITQQRSQGFYSCEMDTNVNPTSRRTFQTTSLLLQKVIIIKTNCCQTKVWQTGFVMFACYSWSSLQFKCIKMSNFCHLTCPSFTSLKQYWNPDCWLYVPSPLRVCAWIAPTEGAGAPADPEDDDEKRLCRAGADPETFQQRRIKERSEWRDTLASKQVKSEGKFLLPSAPDGSSHWPQGGAALWPSPRRGMGRALQTTRTESQYFLNVLL